MAVDWQSINSFLNDSKTVTLSYSDDKGREIPISCESEFREAVKHAKKNGKNYIRFSIKSNELSPHEGFSIKSKGDNSQECISNKSKKKVKAEGNSTKDDFCELNTDVPPAWFVNYMKKFKKKILEEIRGELKNIVHDTCEKETKKLLNKLEMTGLMFPANYEGKKKEIFDIPYNLSDEIEKQRLQKKWKEVHKACMKEIKLAGRQNEIVDNIEKGFKQEKTKQHQHPKLEKKNADVLLNSPKFHHPSVMFLNQVYKTTVIQNKSLCIHVPIVNVSEIPVKKIKILCSTMDGVSLNKTYFEIGVLSPGKRYGIILYGKVSNEIGVYYIVCRIYQGSKELCHPLICTVNVVNQDSLECCKQKLDYTETISSDVILKCQKEIQENMNEIQERLESINTLRSQSIEKIFPTNFSCDKEKMFGKECFHTGTGDESKKEQDFIKKDNELEKFIANSSNVGDSIEEVFDINGKTTVNVKNPADNYFDIDNNFENKKKLTDEEIKNEKKTKGCNESDSELSVISVSDKEEDDEAFVILKLTGSNSDSEEEEVKNEAITKEIFTDADVKGKFNENDNSNQKENEAGCKADKKAKKINEGQFNSTRTRSIFSSNRKLSKKKKHKMPRSTNYHFTTNNLTEPTFMVNPDKNKKGENIRTVDFDENKSDDAFKMFTRNENKKEEKKSSKTTYVIDENGFCIPLRDYLENESENSFANGTENKNNDHAEFSNESNSNNNSGNESEASVNVLPDALVNGASNVASMAINTAKSVINNLQSAFVSDGKTEEGKPACEFEKNKKLSLDANYKLLEMGFEDFDLNEKLLSECDNNLSKVIEKLIEISKKKNRLLPDYF